ncbi:TrmH family RNA methyltransferase [Enterovirga rhinocerotis]|uniref:tRNA G18 (Ribose-2'-O)-methylase SpoU n=1 Tax=Enterovirga rhinocerotis TaxID=1339210 RepID=A0A4R7BW10_9HYPH|nr:RNA methyltransferase [Enterovirga rhinocerotis]TDR89741.1 tRNA G18 (ribose-2'-O)-methylase SpoU [Enterovirga rhinocerotis]
MDLIPIDDAEDPRIEPYRHIRERDLIGRDGLFIAEGEVVLRLLLSAHSRFRPLSILAAEGRAATALELRAEAERRGAIDLPIQLPIHVASRRVMDSIAGFPIHRGLLALGRRGTDPEPAALLPAGPALVLGLVGIANHDNVGGVFRNAAAFGAAAVLLDGQSCDPLYRKAIRVSVGAALTVPFSRGGSADEMVGTLAGHGFEVFALSPAGPESLHDVAWPARRALLVGTEGEGLPPSLLSRLRSVRIDMAPGFDSLNLATASGIALHAACGTVIRPSRN